MGDGERVAETGDTSQLEMSWGCGGTESGGGHQMTMSSVLHPIQRTPEGQGAAMAPTWRVLELELLNSLFPTHLNYLKAKETGPEVQAAHQYGLEGGGKS